MNAIAKTLVLTLCAVLSTFLLQAQQNDEPYLTKTFVASSVKNIKMRTSGGSLTLTGKANEEAKVEVYIQSNNWNGRDQSLSKQEIEERLKEYELSVEQRGDSLIATARRKRDNWNSDDWKRSLSISFRAIVPEKMNTDVKTSGGSISIKNLNGKINFSTSGGSLQARRLSGVVRGKTSGGSIELSDSKDDIELTTSGGSINAESSEGNLTLLTSGGSMSLSDLKGTINARTSGGSINGDNLNGDILVKTGGSSVSLKGISGTLDAATSGGSMDIEILNLGKSLSLRTSAGNVSLKMPLDKGMNLDLRANKIKIPLSNFNGDTEENSIKGTLNGGGIPVKISVSSGNLTVRDSK